MIIDSYYRSIQSVYSFNYFIENKLLNSKIEWNLYTNIRNEASYAFSNFIIRLENNKFCIYENNEFVVSLYKVRQIIEVLNNNFYYGICQL